MDAASVLSLAISAAIGSGVAWWLVSRRTAAVPRDPSMTAASAQGPYATTAAASMNVPQMLEAPSSLVIQNSQGEQAIAITELPLALFDKVASTSCRPPKNIGRLNSLLQAAPTSVAAAQGIPANVYEVAINGPLIAAKDAAGNVIEGGYRAMSKGANGQFTEHAVLSNPGSLNQAMNAAAVWQIASVVVAQKHLADISQKLDALETGMDRLDGKIDAKRQGMLMGAIEHLKEISRPILTGDYNATLRQSIEDHAKDLLACRNEVSIILNKRIAALPDVKDPDAINADGLADMIRQEMDAIAVHLREWLLSSHARFQAWSLLTAMPGEQTLKQERYSQILADLEKMRGDGSPIQAFAMHTRKLINRVHARVWSAEALAKLRTELGDELTALVAELEADFASEWRLVQQGTGLLQDVSEPTRFLVKSSGNEIVELKHLPAFEAPKMLMQELQPSVFSPQLLGNSAAQTANHRSRQEAP